MTIEELVAEQARIGAGADHLVWIDEDKWVCAHTDDERAEGIEDLVDCPLNDWLEEWGAPPEKPGHIYVVVPYEDDWEFLALDEGDYDNADR